ncbi:MAG TPA: DNA-binding response regulator [Ktedonobacter sp.]|nr:DNA-binding response regulator [Ktedonobacter sp.]
MTQENASPNLPKTPIRIILADDHEMLRQGLRLLLGLQQDMQVVGEARTGSEAVELVEQLAPDVVIMDISLPEMDGLEACAIIRQRHPSIHILVLTMHESEEYFLKALRMGAGGYLIKKAAPHELHAAVRAVAHGEVYLYPGLAKALVRTYVAPSQSSSAVNTTDERRSLTPREVEVLTMVAQGMTSQQIAEQLGISVKTVQAHRANVMEKLELRDVTQLVRFAIRTGLLPPES